MGLLETTNLSVGRGTNTPIELIGAPWIKGKELTDALNQVKLPGFRIFTLSYQLDGGTFAS